MNRSRLALTLGAALAPMLLSPNPAAAWDTFRNGTSDWRSIYCVAMSLIGNPCDGKTTGSFHGGNQPPAGNEHAEAADDALFFVGKDVHAKTGVMSCRTEGDSEANCPTIVDLNASWLRRNVLDGTPTFGDIGATVLEERKMPPLAMWSGLPDFAYTVYDWVNKLQICPSLPKSAPGAMRDLCWNYSAMLGGSLNSTHMGRLAMKVYHQHHGIAVAEAKRARELHALLKVGGFVKKLKPGHEWHAEYVKEAEMLALIYEMTGQHYLQDRWSAGHMLSRWGSGDYDEWSQVSFGGAPPELFSMMMQGLVTGIIHGTAALNGSSDPLNHPLLKSAVSTFGGFEGLEKFTDAVVEAAEAFVSLFFQVDKETAYITGFRWPEPISGTNLHQSPHKAVGDHLLEALVEGRYTGNAQFSADVDLAPASNQKKAMRYCAGQGIREVIGAMYGDSAEATTRGASAFALDPPEEGYQVLPYGTTMGSDPSLDDLCTEHWVTNEAYYAGVRTLAGQVGLAADIMVFAKGALTHKDSGLGPVVTPPVLRLPGFLNRIGGVLTYLAFKARRNMERDERKAGSSAPAYGVQSARASFHFATGGVTWRPNYVMGLPKYYEPMDLDRDLPDKDNEHGRDWDAIAGFFNKAKTEYWCSVVYQKLEELRDSIADPTSDTLQQRDRAVCSYLANRVYRGTDSAYKKGNSRYERIGEHLPRDEADPDKRFGPDFEPICAYFDGLAPAIQTKDASDDHKPYYVRPGYVGTPGQWGDLTYGPKSLENLCDQIPVIDLTPDDTDDADSVGRLLPDDGDRWLELVGENLGIKTSNAVGTVELRDSEGGWQALDIWDGHNQLDKGGWSLDNQTVDVRIPGSGRGFPSNAAPNMLPHAILGVAPATYELRLTRPGRNPAAQSFFKADGRGTVGRYVVEVTPSYAETDGLYLGVDQAGSYWATWPAWLRDQSEILAAGFYSKANGVYTKLDVAYVVYDGSVVTFDSNGGVVVQPDANKYSVVVPKGHADVFDGSVVFFFAYH